MNCDAARFALGADPGSAEPMLAAHVQSCADCAAYRAELVELDQRLRAAMQVPVPEPSARSREPDVARQPPNVRHSTWLALAASVGAITVLFGLLWGGFPRASLAADVVAHMSHEPSAWAGTVALPAAQVERALKPDGVALRHDAVDVTYVATCWFRGRRVPHLVVASEGGPVTVMVLADEPVAARTAFDERGYRGVLVPAHRGSLAVLARDADGIDVEAVAARTLEALRY